jgi:hypothetical protein
MAVKITPLIEEKFRTSDGQIFDSKYAAESHEKDLIVNLNVEYIKEKIHRYQAEVPEWITKLPGMSYTYTDKYRPKEYRNFARVFTTALEAVMWENSMEEARLQLQPVINNVNLPVTHHPGKREYGTWDAPVEKPAAYLWLTEIHFENLKKKAEAELAAGSLDV